MINTQVHHSAIGLHLDKAQSLSSKGKGRLSFFVESSKNRKVVKISRYLNLKIALIVLIYLGLSIQAIISGMQLKGGDIETNLGPTTYNLEKMGRRTWRSAWVLLSVCMYCIICIMLDSDKTNISLG